MKENALRQYTKQKCLYGQNSQQILDKFVKYSDICSDPMNVYKYMEQRSICIYLSSYWANRASLFAQMGDFKDALFCLKETASRNHIVSQIQVKIEEYYERVKKRMVTAMKRHPPKGKRSANEYNFLYQKDGKTDAQNLSKLVQVFEKNYKEAKSSIEKEFSLKMHGKAKSWMAEIYEENELKIRKLSQKLKSSNNQAFFSMQTPISKKDPMRLTKTMDSIQMLKKKKSTQPKQRKKQKFGESNHQMEGENEVKQQKINQESSDSLSDQDQQSTPMCMNTTPVTMLSRRVTFNSKNNIPAKIEKIRSQLNDDRNLGHSIDKAENSEDYAQRSKSMSKRGSILKNKSILKQTQMEKEASN